MLQRIGSIGALLLSTAFLLSASGLHGLLLPLRGQEDGFSAFALGLIGTGYATGFIAGSLYTPRLVSNVGHVRAFSAFAALGAVIALVTGLIVTPTVWILLRIVTGFAMAGSFMVIESWLHEKATNETRGAIFGVYLMVTYAAVMGGQLLVTTSDVQAEALFMICAILFCMAVLPTAVTRAATPEPLREVRLDLRALYRNSPAAFIGCLMIGVGNGGWGTLGAVYGAQHGIAKGTIAMMMGVPMIAGAVMQLPAGRISDKVDRRIVLAVIAFAGVAASFALFLVQPVSFAPIMVMMAFYGAAAHTIYSLAVAHANDHAKPDEFVRVSGGLLLLYGFGTVIGPLAGAGLMQAVSPGAIFLVPMVAHGITGVSAVLRIRKRAPVPQDEKDAFQQMPLERAVTPETLRLDPRGEEDGGIEEATPDAVMEDGEPVNPDA